MHAFALITADILFLALIVLGVFLERRLSRLEFARLDADSREESAYFDLAFKLDSLSKRLDDLTPPVPDQNDSPRDSAAEKRFSEGVASILAYDLRRHSPHHPLPDDPISSDSV